MLASRAPACRASRAFSARRSAAPLVCRASLEKVAASAAAALVLSSALAAPALAGVSFANVKSGATLSSPVHLDFAVEGLTVKPAAEGITPGTGHHHLIIDAPAPAAGEAIPFDDVHKHFGKGQTSVDLDLAPGSHKLTLQFANAAHESYGPAYSSTITVNVK